MPVSAAITFRMTMGSGYVAVIRGMPVTPQVMYELCKPLLIEPVGVVEGTPEKEGRLFRCMLCSQVF